MAFVSENERNTRLFGFFEELSKIPRGSGNEAAAADYLCAFARAHSLEYLRDGANNVLIKKAPSKGYEDHAPVLLQAHVDMVCVKTEESEHDFESEPIKPIEKDGFICASGTTLGADDGAGVAMMLLLLDDESALHPPLECLFTTGEEIGMLGALAFDYSTISASRVISLDGDDEGVAVIGCAGGLEARVNHEHDAVDIYGRCLSVTLSGFAGGHSGLDIHRERVNAIVLLSRILASLYEAMPFGIVSMRGGDVSNAIPSEAEAVIAVPDEKSATDFIEKKFAEYRAGLGKADRAGKLRVRRAKTVEIEGRRMLSFRSVSRLLSFLTLAPCGVLSCNKKDTTVIEASCNLASIVCDDGGSEEILLMRSHRASEQTFTAEKLVRLVRLCGATVTLGAEYPEWVPTEGGTLRSLWSETYRELFPSEAEPKAYPIHIGLECGIIARGIKEASGAEPECIAIGPQIYDIHTVRERMKISSYERFSLLVTELLKKI